MHSWNILNDLLELYNFEGYLIVTWSEVWGGVGGGGGLRDRIVEGSCYIPRQDISKNKQANKKSNQDHNSQIFRLALDLPKWFLTPIYTQWKFIYKSDSNVKIASLYDISLYKM